MITIKFVRWCVVLSLAVGSLMATDNPTEPQKKNPKELMKEAEADEGQGHWETALEKLKTAANIKRKDKAIAAALQQAKEHLADQTANQAIGSCNVLKLDVCEQQVNLALSYAHTQRASEAERQLAARKAELQKRWDHAEQMISSHQLEEANKELESLGPYPYLFPALSGERQRLLGLRIRADIELGRKDLDGDQFDAARQAFGAALALDPGNTEAARGIEAADKGTQAVRWNEEAKSAFSEKKYKDAYLSNQKALGSLPGRKEYLDLNKQISAEWLKVLEDEHGLNPDPNSLPGNQAAWESLEWIQLLDPQYAALAEATRKIKLNLYSNYNTEAARFQLLPKYSGIGTAYLFHVNAQRMNPDPKAEDPFAATFSEVTSLFARKRAMLVLVSVANLTPVPPVFTEVATRRVRAAIDALGLADLKVSSAEDYAKNPDEDAYFQDYRPDGKSRVALLTLNIMNYEGGNTGNETPEEKHSQFVSGQETVQNPDYEKAMEKFNTASDALARAKGKVKKGVPTPAEVSFLEQQVTQTPQKITRDKIVDYTYQEYHLDNKAHIAMKLEIRDMLEKRLLGSDAVEATEEAKATEIDGVQSRDVNGLLNRQARIKTTQQLQQDADLDALKALDGKVPALLAKYDQRFYNEGEKAWGEGRTDEAVENFLCYWFTFRGQMDENRAQHIREVVKGYIGLDLGASASLLTAP